MEKTMNEAIVPVRTDVLTRAMIVIGASEALSVVVIAGHFSGFIESKFFLVIAIIHVILSNAAMAFILLTKARIRRKFAAANDNAFHN